MFTYSFENIMDSRQSCKHFCFSIVLSVQNTTFTGPAIILSFPAVSVNVTFLSLTSTDQSGQSITG